MRTIVSLFLLLLVAAAPAQPNLVKNPGFEQAGKDSPAHWEPVAIGVAPTFATDTVEHHGGDASARITAEQTTRAYFASEPIAVAPGEKLKATAWVKMKDVPEQLGTVILIGMFSRADGSGPQAEKFAVAKKSTTTQPISGWQQIEGTLTVPDEMDVMRVRAGFSYSSGTCWWDDIVVHAVEPLVARVELDRGRLTPAMDPLPVTILNRTAMRGEARVIVTLNGKKFEQNVQLDGKAEQQIGVPIEITKRGKADLTLAVSHGGKEVFTRKMETVVPPALVLDPPCPTHWAIEDGAPRVDGEVVLALKHETLEGGKLAIGLFDDAGKNVFQWHTDQPKNGVERYELQMPSLPEGKYKVLAIFYPRSGEAINAEGRFEVIPRHRSKVTINSNGYCEYEGKPIFPLGIFNSGRAAEMGDGGFTLTHAYNAVRVFTGERGNDQAALEFLDGTEKAGLKALCMVPLAFANDKEWDKFRRRIRMFRNHPALLAWDEEEGLARGDWNLDTLKKVRQILNEEDPNHPFMVGDGRDVVYRLKDRSNFFPVDQMDMGMWWWYPLPLEKKARLDVLEGAEVSGLELVPPEFLTKANTSKPIWVGVQSYKKGDNSRFPTPLEYRAQAYIAIAEGAKGLMWYGGYVHGGIFQNDNRKEGHFEELCKIVKELHSLDAVWTGTTEAKPTVSRTNAPISVTLKRGGGKLVLVAVNRTEKPLEVEITSPLIRAGRAGVVGEAHEVTTNVGSIHDRFEPYVSHVYQLPE